MACNIIKPMFDSVRLTQDHRLPQLHRCDGPAEDAGGGQPWPSQPLLHRPVGGGEKPDCHPDNSPKSILTHTVFYIKQYPIILKKPIARPVPS